MVRSDVLISAALAALVVIAAGCASSNHVSGGGGVRKPVKIDRIDPRLEALSPQLDVSHEPTGSYRFLFSAGASGTGDAPSMQALRQIDSVTFEVTDRDGSMLAALSTSEVPTSGVTGADGVASLTATASVYWEPSEAPQPGAMVRMIVHGRNGAVERTVPLPATSQPRRALATPLSMVLEAESTAGQLQLRLNVERKAAAPPDEYLPSGELYRIEIFDDVGETVWSTAAGRMFTQAIQPVAPTRIGERVTYTENFNGLDARSGRPLPAGRYQIVATIPAQPRPYILREELNWSGRP